MQIQKSVFYYCQTSVLFLYNWGIFSGDQSLLALYLSGTPSLKTGTSPPYTVGQNQKCCAMNIKGPK